MKKGMRFFGLSRGKAVLAAVFFAALLYFVAIYTNLFIIAIELVLSYILACTIAFLYRKQRRR